MRALLDETQQEFQGVAREIAQSLGIQNPADLDGRSSGWPTLASAGLLELRERTDGEPTAGGVEIALLLLELGAALVPDPFLPSAVVAGDLLARADASAELQSGLGSGEILIGILLTADLTGFGSPDDADAVVWGGAGEVGRVLAVRQTDQGADLMLGTSSGALALDAISLTNTLWRADMIAWETVGSLSRDDLDRALALALTGLSADTVGSSNAALRGVVEYSKQRIAYGVHIGSFQTIQHLAADTLVAIAGVRAATLYAAWAIDELEASEALLAARTAKAAAARMGQRTGEDVMQIYGGIGQTWEHIAHFHARRAIFNAAVLGGEDNQLDAIADARLGGN
ncbi:acyl-CoA dehydrogenase family protein [Microbacterium sp. A82]|uniref:acyl-CoA dehydrogenase family protein n=1 Tax=Microbacterium sp. A82 TaxID=3450452 RepID=UPI003F3D579B